MSLDMKEKQKRINTEARRDFEGINRLIEPPAMLFGAQSSTNHHQRLNRAVIPELFFREQTLVASSLRQILKTRISLHASGTETLKSHWSSFVIEKEDFRQRDKLVLSLRQNLARLNLLHRPKTTSNYMDALSLRLRGFWQRTAINAEGQQLYRLVSQQTGEAAYMCEINLGDQEMKELVKEAQLVLRQLKGRFG